MTDYREISAQDQFFYSPISFAALWKVYRVRVVLTASTRRIMHFLALFLDWLSCTAAYLPACSGKARLWTNIRTVPVPPPDPPPPRRLNKTFMGARNFNFFQHEIMLKLLWYLITIVWESLVWNMWYLRKNTNFTSLFTLILDVYMLKLQNTLNDHFFLD
jgi:hypothetical protein